MQNIKTKTIDNVTYYTLTSRGVVYTLYYVDSVGAWGLASRREALGRNNAGSFRYFDTLEQLENKLKAFRGISCLLDSNVTTNA